MKIYKYGTIDNGFTGKFTISMPKGAKILTIQLDVNKIPCIWAMVDETAESEERFFELFGTGHEIPVDMGIERVYIGTYSYQGGAFIGHVFERL